VILDDPQLRGPATATSLPMPSFGETLVTGVQSGFQETSVGNLWQVFAHHVGAGAGDPLTEDQYKLSKDFRPGMYEPGMTTGLAAVKAAHYDEQQRQALVLGRGSKVAAGFGNFTGAMFDPLYYIPFVDELAPVLKLARSAETSEVLTQAVNQSLNASLATLAEQPLAYVRAKEYNEQFDLSDVGKSVFFASLGGGFFGGLGAKLNLRYEQKVAGMQKALDDIHMGRQVDATAHVQPRPDQGLAVRRALADGVLPDGIDPETLDPASMRALSLASRGPSDAVMTGAKGVRERLEAIDQAKRALTEEEARDADYSAANAERHRGIIADQQRALREATWSEDDRAFMESYTKDGGLSYYEAQLAEELKRPSEYVPGVSEERRTDVEQRKLAANMSHEELKQAYLTDELTGLPNKRAMLEAEAKGELQGEMVHSDLDSFKRVNDEKGHENGDLLIKLAGGVYKDAFEAVGGKIFRWGGDEFFGSAPSKALADKAMAEVRRRLKSAKVHITLPDGRREVISDLGASYGTGASHDAAETALQADKRRAGKAPASFSPAGGEDAGAVSPGAAEGRADRQGGNPSKVAYLRQQIAALKHPEPDWSPTGPKPEPVAEPDLSRSIEEPASTEAVNAKADKLDIMARGIKRAVACYVG
jgi:diguanylate cyclase (GGDEF)-like protein